MIALSGVTADAAPVSQQAQLFLFCTRKIGSSRLTVISAWAAREAREGGGRHLGMDTKERQGVTVICQTHLGQLLHGCKLELFDLGEGELAE